jgi:hypothetical protein
MVRTNKIKGLSQAPIWQEPTMAPANDAAGIGHKF